MERVQAIRGMKDVLPFEVGVWQHIERVARDVFSVYGFSEIRPPVLERTELYIRSIGEATDIVEKEMYSFRDRSGDSLTLRPEATAGILRSYIEHALYQNRPHWKLYCIGPMFRHERPQKGRYRQFHQINAEILGSAAPRTDAELLIMLHRFFRELGMEDLDFQVNSLGCPVCRPALRDEIVSCLRGRERELCEDCRRRLLLNPLRIYDCKVRRCGEIIQEAPRILDLLCRGCRDHLTEVESYLERMGVPYTLNPYIVRGLDYYTRTTFEVISRDLGAQNSVCGGGRYDHLIHELGGPDHPGIGFAIGEERLASVLMEKGIVSTSALDFFVVALGRQAEREAFAWAEKARGLGLATEMDFRGGSLKAQLRRADKEGARRVLILGEAEIASRRAPLRDMEKGTQVEIPLEALEGLLARWAKDK